MGNSAKLESLKKELLPELKRHAFIQLEKPITLASGKVSSTYFDGKQITLFPNRLTLFARAILELVDLDAIDAVGGPTIGADPIATAVSLIAFLEKKKSLPAFIVRKEPKKHGLRKSIEGCPLKQGDRLLIVEDVVTSGKSVMQAIQVVESLGCRVAQIACLVDREEGASEAFRPYRFTPVFKRAEVDQ